MKTSVTIPLTDEELELLTLRESTIEDGLSTFVAVGSALLEISEKRLYRMTHGSFEPYCKDKWGMSARRAYQLCEASKVVSEIPKACTNGSQLNERQARELAKVAPAKRIEVLEKAKASGRVTAKAIKEIASEPTERPRIQTADDEFRDAMGMPEADAMKSELAQIQEQLRVIEIHITDADLTGEDYTLLSKEIFRLSERVARIGRSKSVSEVAA